MSWYRIDLSPEQAEFGFVDIIRAEMEEVWLSRGGLQDFSVWLRQDESASTIYFSPVAAEMAQLLIFRFGGTPCDDPDKKRLTFLLGHAFRDDLI